MGPLQQPAVEVLAHCVGVAEAVRVDGALIHVPLHAVWCDGEAHVRGCLARAGAREVPGDRVGEGGAAGREGQHGGLAEPDGRSRVLDRAGGAATIPIEFVAVVALLRALPDPVLALCGGFGAFQMIFFCLGGREGDACMLGRSRKKRKQKKRQGVAPPRPQHDFGCLIYQVIRGGYVCTKISSGLVCM